MGQWTVYWPFVSCRSVLRVINNLHGPVMWDSELSTDLLSRAGVYFVLSTTFMVQLCGTVNCLVIRTHVGLLCGIYYLHCPFLWYSELSSSLDPSRKVLCDICNLHCPFLCYSELSSSLDPSRKVLCDICNLHCPFLWDCELSSSLDKGLDCL